MHLENIITDGDQEMGFLGSDGQNPFEKRVWTGRDLNPRPLPCEGSDLPS